MEIYYWKNQRHEEVDFVVKEGAKAKQLMQVCWNINEYKKKIKVEDKIYKVKFLPLWKWLLENHEMS